MTPGQIATLIGAIVGVGGLFVTLLRARGESSSKSTELKQELDARIDARVDAQLTEAWKRITSLEGRSKTQDFIVSVLGSGFDALSGVIERVEPPPHILRWEAEAIRKAKEVRADDSLWPSTATPPKAEEPPLSTKKGA